MNPPFTGVAVNVIGSPAQTVGASGAMDTPTVRGFFAVIVIPGDVAGFPVTQLPRFEVRTQVTTSLFAGI